ncbi:uncharacterized protein TNIN_28571 [Trichonephila inaurata madagascariensis]|uniref:Uncharacterized protein n=1 Tax=Trichonephila inaurata madagascariensis TaxID=2747483 RepID=A0A8X7CKU4_9ARAC|nr:uncharacterized protein TNIN_28571 [Trichonephila inaurata madagascariensis]
MTLTTKKKGTKKLKAKDWDKTVQNRRSPFAILFESHKGGTPGKTMVPYSKIWRIPQRPSTLLLRTDLPSSCGLQGGQKEECSRACGSSSQEAKKPSTILPPHRTDPPSSFSPGGPFLLPPPPRTTPILTLGPEPSSPVPVASRGVKRRMEVPEGGSPKRPKSPQTLSSSEEASPVPLATRDDVDSISSKEDSLVADRYNLRPRKYINYSDSKNSKVKKNHKLAEGSVVSKRDATKFKNNYNSKLTICPLTDPTLFPLGKRVGSLPFSPLFQII